MLNCLLVLLIAFVGFFGTRSATTQSTPAIAQTAVLPTAMQPIQNATNNLDGLPYVSASSLNARAQQSAMIYASAAQPIVQARSSR